MDFGEKDIKKISLLVLVVILLILVFLVIKPFIVSIVGGLLLAYVFMPLYRKINLLVKHKGVSASIVVVIIVVGLLAVLWFITPLLIKQLFELLLAIQKIDIQSVVTKIFPTATASFVTQMTLTLNSAVGKAFAFGTTFLSDLLSNLPKIILNFFILGFVFFFSLRDSDKMASFIRGVSPLSEVKEKIIVKHFKDMTGAVINGWVIVGLIQGTLAGIGLFLFGVDNALVLTILAMFLSVIPFLGPAFVWIPVSIYILTQQSFPLFIGFLLYNLLIVSLADNILRSYIISRRTDIPSAIILIGMIGGLFVFGIVGLIVGPLILAYLLTLLESFKDRSIYSLFS